MQLKDLVGRHVLTGVSRNRAYGMAEHFSFCLDNTTYTAVEAPDDGYQSSMAELIVTLSPNTTRNMFAPHDVVAVYDPKGCDILTLIDLVTGREVLRVGTDNTDDYYPVFVAQWMPENLAANVPSNELPKQEPKFHVRRMFASTKWYVQTDNRWSENDPNGKNIRLIVDHGPGLSETEAYVIANALNALKESN